MRTCKGNCNNEPKPIRVSGLRYYEVQDNKKCSQCEYDTNTPAKFCHCCLTVLRRTPKNKNRLLVVAR